MAGGHSAHPTRSGRSGRKLRSSKADPAPEPPADLSECGYCTEEQLEDLLLKNLDFAYHEALARLAALGYGADVAMKAVLCGGHCCGPTDVIGNIVANAVEYLDNPGAIVVARSGSSSSAGGGAGGFAGFSDLRRLEEYSLAGMVCLVQQHRRGLSRGDAMWCLLMGELHVGRACQIDLPPPNCSSPSPSLSHPSPAHHPPAQTPGGGGEGKGGGLGFRPFVRVQGKGAGGMVLQGSEDFIDKLMKELEELRLEEKTAEPDAQAERIYDLIRQAREMEAQVKERKEWAQQKALQAARKLSHDTMELRNLRTEREKRERAKKAGNGPRAVVPDEGTVRRLEQMEDALKKASLQVDRANAEVHRLESENAEIRAEMEAAKLSAAESIRARQEAARREKKLRKKSLTRNRQRLQLQAEVEEARRAQPEIAREIDGVQRGARHLEVRLTDETKAKDETLAQLEELNKTTDSIKSNAQRRIDSLRQKTDLDSQRCKDDILRLQEELSRLQSLQFNTTTVRNNSNNVSNNVVNVNNGGGLNSGGKKERRKWQCVVCVKDEVSVLLLPCTHQVLCVGCSECHVSTGKARCPSCNTRIEERIRVFGVST